MCAFKRRTLRRTLVVTAALFVLGSIPLGAQTTTWLGDVKVALSSTRYYKGGDYTRFAYRVTVPATSAGAYWILNLCSSAAAALWYTTPSSTVVTTPLAGVKFSITATSQTFSVYVRGRWTLAGIPVGACWSVAPPCTFVTGWINGPVCAASSLSISVVSGDEVAFPVVTGPGLFAAANPTVLRVVSSAAGWVLSASEEYFIPAGSSETVVGRIFEIALGSYAAGAGTTDVSASYALRVAEEDLASLPQGTYDITITYTVTLD